MDSPRPRLPTRLDEFRTALEEEILAAQRDKSNSVLLTAGRFVAKIGGEFHYEFETTSAVRVPPDTEGELTLDGRPTPLNVTVVAIDEPKITLSCEESIGRAPPKAKLKTDLTMLLRRLIRRIEQKADRPWPAADRVLDGGPVVGTPSAIEDLADANEGQRRAVECALGRELTFVWGPPGTGKTKTIGWIGRELFKRRRTLLVVSHTNVAVDEALHQIAKGCSFTEGEIIRIGKPVKAELEKRDDLIGECIAAKRKQTLAEQKAALEEERAQGTSTLSELERLVDVVEWAMEAEGDLQDFRDRMAKWEGFSVAAAAALASQSQALTEYPLWETRQRDAKKAQLAAERWSATVRLQSEQAAARAALEKRFEEVQTNAAIEFNRLSQSRAAEPLRQRRSALPSISTLIDVEREAQAVLEKRAHVLAAKNQETALARELLRKIEGMGKIRRLWHGLPSLEHQTELVKLHETAATTAQVSFAQAEHSLRTAKRNRVEAEALDSALAPLMAVPSLEEQEETYSTMRRSEDAMLDELATLDRQIREARAVQESCDKMLRQFWQDHHASPEEVLRLATDFFEHAHGMRTTVQSARAAVARLEHELEIELRRRLDILRELKLTEALKAPLREMMRAIEAAFAQAVEIERATPLPTLLERRDRLRRRIEQIGQELAAIDEQIDRVMIDLLLNARVIATTLTRAFMRDVLQERRFDTVLCDEASMAPIPALWAAATLASESVVVVGDFRQLPPIVQSEHALAEHWLGRDIFEASGIRAAWDRKQPPDFFVPLKEQFRMHPDISAAPNALLYDKLLQNGPNVTAKNADDNLLEWYHSDWGYDRPLLLIDTSNFGGWNNRSGNSRLNFLSALMCVRLAGVFLKPDRPKWTQSDGRRIFVITPYRPQAHLINLLLKENGIAGEVQASTAHSCQGGEAELVLIDLTVDQPHASTTLTTKAANEDVSRLMNVAMTRAKRRLVVIGNFSWLKSKGKGAFVGGKLLPHLLAQHTAIPALDVWSNLKPAEPCSLIDDAVVADKLSAFIGKVRRNLTIWSPMLSSGALERIKPDLEAFLDRAGELFLFTRPIHESKGATSAERTRLEEMLASLRSRGANVIFKPGMHEKFLMADARVVWSAPFALLAVVSAPGWVEVRGALGSTQELGFHNEIWDCLRMDLVRAAAREQQVRCPICDSEMWLAETGPKSDQPFYWKCPRADCFTRGLRDPGVVDGLLRFECRGHPSLDYRGETPVWACNCGERHRRNVKKAHLRLPKMRALIPEHRKKRLMRILGVTDAYFLRQGDLQF